MTAAWMLYLLLVGTLMTLAARLLAMALRTFGRPTRWVWAGALASVLALALFAPRQEMDRRTLAPTATRATVVPAVASATLDPLARVQEVYRAVDAGTTEIVYSLSQRVPRAMAIAFAAVWAAGSAVLLALFVAVNVRLARARRRWPVSQACGSTVRVAPDSGPAVLGLLRAEIVVPRSLLERSAEEQRLILAHEREHLRARDHLLLAGAWLVAIAFPWHPAVWALINRLRLAIELDCDARVLRAGESAKSYGALLIDVAAHHGGIRIGALALADGPSHLERRILAMNAPRKRHALAYGALLSGLGGLLVLAACEAKVPTSAEIAQMDVATAEKSAAEAGFMVPDNRTDFFLNGVKVTADRARAIEAKDIGSIEIVKSERPTGRDTIFVTTPDRMPRPTMKGDSLEAARSGGSEYAVVQKKVEEASHEKLVAHVEAERGIERMRIASGTALQSKIPSPPPPMRMKMRSGEQKPVILIDGKRASEAQLAALDEKDIAAMAVYKGKERLDFAARNKAGLDITSAPPGAPNPDGNGAVISVTTKMARANAKP